ncbi:hypothetical protein QTP86_002980 [Hemibagrus guttatus]|nr:hypothetical protein QTP86_002980 [Hemibagrus guttatus]
MKVVEICEQQYGFMPRKSTTDAIFALRILMEKYRDGQRELHCVFVDLEKAYDRVPREELWYCMRKSGVAEKYVRVVQDMYERSRTVVRCAVGQTEEFKVEVGLHQGSALSPFLFAIVMDQLSEEVRQESPWTMMFADDIVICSESREQVEENLERWRFALERRGMKVSRSKTEYMCVNEREGSGTVRLHCEEVKKVQEFKYLGSAVQSNGECGKEVKKQVQAGWNGWRKVSGVLCDRKISARIKGKVYRTVVRAAMLYGLETVSLRKRQESELEVAELKMLRFSLGVTRLDRIRNEYIRGTAHVGRLGDKVREARLRWFGHVQRRESVLTQDRGWSVEYPDKLICAVRGFSVSIPCSYSYPQNHQVKQKLWCSMNSNTFKCEKPPYVYDSSSNTTSDFEFTGDDKSDCTLLIHNVQYSYSGEYRFRFITNVDKWTGHPGVTLQVTGDDPENPEKPENPENPETSLHWSICVIVCVTAGVSVIFSVIIGTVIHNRRFLCDRRSVHSEQPKDDFATDSNVQKNEDDSATYCNVQKKEEDSAIYANV